MRISQEFPKQQPHGGVVDDQRQPIVVRIPGLVSPVLANFASFRRFSPRVIATRGVFSSEPSGNSLTPFGQPVDGVLGGLEPGGGVRILPFIGFVLFDRLDQTEVDEKPGHLADFSPIDRRAAIHQPIHRRFPGEGVLDHSIRQFSLFCDFHPNQPVVVITERVRIRRGDAMLEIGPLLADKAPEDDFNRGPIVRQLVRHPVSFHDDQLHRVPRAVENFQHMSLLDAVALAKPCQHMDAFGRQLPHGVFEGEAIDQFAVGGFDKAGVHEPLTHRSCHLLGHGKCGRRRRRHDSRRVFGVRHSVGLGEFERTKIVDGFLGGEGVLDLLETYSVGRQR